MTLQIADLLAVGGIVLGSSLAVVGGALVCLKSELSAFRSEFHTGIQTVRTEIPSPRSETQAGLHDPRAELRLLNSKLDAFTEAIIASGLICHSRARPSEPDPSTATVGWPVAPNPATADSLFMLEP